MSTNVKPKPHTADDWHWVKDEFGHCLFLYSPSLNVIRIKHKHVTTDVDMGLLRDKFQLPEKTLTELSQSAPVVFTTAMRRPKM